MSKNLNASDLPLQPGEQTNSETAPSETKSGVSRRAMLTAGATTAATLLALPKRANALAIEQSSGGQKLVNIAQVPPPGKTVAPADAAISYASPVLNQPSDTSITQSLTTVSSAYHRDSPHTFRTAAANLDIIAYDPTSSGVYTRRFQNRDDGTVYFPGPVLSLYPGDRIALNLANKLPVNDASTYCSNPDSNRPKCLNDSNLHFHGLHVSPMSVTSAGRYVNGNAPLAPGEYIVQSSDDVLYTLPPGNNNSYCVQLPSFHAPGTHWYHAHIHGTTALDVDNGLVGAIIVNEPAGQEILAGAPDVVMIIQEQSPPLPATYNAPAGGQNFNLTAQQLQDRAVYENVGNVKSAYTLNGQQVRNFQGINTPVPMTIKNGEVQRWRIINATGTPRSLLRLQLVDTASNTPQTLYCVAVDGITLYGKSMASPYVKLDGQNGSNNYYEIPPGGRVDFLVYLPYNNQAGANNTYQLQMQRSPNANAGGGGGAGGTLPLSPLTTITVSPIPYDDGTLKNAFDALINEQDGVIRGHLPANPNPNCYLAPLPSSATANPQAIVFQVLGGPGTDDNGNNLPNAQVPGRGNFQISGLKYGTTGAKMTVNLGDTQEWILGNFTSGAFGQVFHPFHIHVNPFQIVDIGTVTASNNAGPYTFTWPGDPGSNLPVYTPDGIWRDTYAVLPNQALKIRHRFFDYPGSYVLHCHILIHEDQGMMWDVTVKDPGKAGSYPCQVLTDCATTNC